MAQEKKSIDAKKKVAPKSDTKRKSTTKKASTKVEEKKEVKAPIKKEIKEEVKESKKEPIKKETPVKEEVKENPEIIVGLNRESQKNYRLLTKIISILAMLGKIFTMIAIPFIFIAAIFFVVIIGKIDYSNDKLYYAGKEVAVFENDGDGLILKINAVVEDKNITIRDNIVLKEIQSLLANMSKNIVISAIVFATVFYEISFVLWVMIYRRLEELFNDFNTGDTPFTDKNTLGIKNIGKLLIVSVIVMALGNGLLEIIIHSNLSINNGAISVMGILIVYTIYYIFKYATKLQAKSNMRIVNNK